METRIGISGWRYEPWRGVFYPPKLPQKLELWFASRQLNTIELNGSFYSLQKPASYKKWYADTPDGFVFAVKGPRYISHIRRLKNSEAPLGNFFASGLLHLKEKLGPILWQLPPNFLFRQEEFETFFDLLPRTLSEAVKLCAKADRVEPDFPSEAKGSDQIIRYALEVRHESFLNPDFIELLRRHNIALVFADTAGKWPYMEDLTSDFVYVRLHGEQEIYKSGYDDYSLKWWQSRLQLWRSGREPSDALTMSDDPAMKVKRDIFVYFDNDVKVNAPFDAINLAERLSSFKPENLNSAKHGEKSKYSWQGLDKKDSLVNRIGAKDSRHDHAEEEKHLQRMAKLWGGEDRPQKASR